MADNQKYYYMRMKEDFFDSEEIVILESMPDGIIYENILLKMYCKSLKSEGRLMFNGVIPYSPAMLASITRQQVGTVEKALDILEKLGLIEILDNGAIYMLNIQNFIGASSSEADRKREYYNSIQEEKRQISEKSPEKSPKVSEKPSREIKIDIENRDIDKDRVIDTFADAKENGDASERSNYCPYEKIKALYHEICKSYPTIKSIEGDRKKAVKARWTAYPNLDTFREMFEKCENSKFLKGNNDRNWKADFDFMMTASKFSKILEGKYDDRGEIAEQHGYKPTEKKIVPAVSPHLEEVIQKKEQRTRAKYANL